ncbi:MAG: putative blue copper protein [Acidimicrobiales bacterium]|nr:putative blue copper protein [Acidimicrobiales bacterium]
MTTIETRPTGRAVAPPTPVPLSPVPPTGAGTRRGSLARRLPYALAALALAAGYAAGHGTNPATPGSSAAAPAAVTPVVTPDQINRALAGTNGHAVVNDRGYSQLENGVQHSHGFDLPMSAADRKELAREMNLARETALQFPTLADAERGGLRRAGPFSPGLGTHLISYANYAKGAGDGPMTDDQIRHPLAWIYDGTKPTSPVAGLFYNATVAKPAGFVGPNDVWHQHTNICITQGKGGIDAPLGADHDATKAQCDAVGGNLIRATGPLLHVWVVPGYEDSQGVYSHLNPAITCDDGTYRIVDITKIGTRLSACRSGTE